MNLLLKVGVLAIALVAGAQALRANAADRQLVIHNPTKWPLEYVRRLGNRPIRWDTFRGSGQ